MSESDITAEKYKEWLMTHTSLMDETRDSYVWAIRKFLAEYQHVTIDNCNEFITKYGSREHRSYYVYAALGHLLRMVGCGSWKKSLVRPKIFPRIKMGNYHDRNTLRNLVDSVCKDEFRLVAEIQFRTGLRACDVLFINPNNIVLEGSIVFVRFIIKGGKEITLPIAMDDEPLVKTLLKLKEERDLFLFWNHRVKRRSLYHFYYNEIRKAAIALGIKFTTHDFRRNWIEDTDKYLKSKGIYDPRVLQNLVGHARMETTIGYLKEPFISKTEVLKDVRLNPSVPCPPAQSRP